MTSAQASNYSRAIALAAKAQAEIMKIFQMIKDADSETQQELIPTYYEKAEALNKNIHRMSEMFGVYVNQIGEDIQFALSTQGMVA